MKFSPLFAFLMALYLSLPCIFAGDPDPPDQRKLRGGSHVDVYEGRHGSYKEARGGSDMDVYKGRHGSHKARGGFDMDEGRHGFHEEARGGSDMDVYKGRHGFHEGAGRGSDMDVYKGRHGSHKEAPRNDSYDEASNYVSYEEQEPSYDSYEEEPSVDSYEEEPSIDSYEEEPSVDSYEEEPSYDSYEEEPSYDSYEEEPSYDSYEEEPSVDYYEEEPSYDSYEEEPSVDSYEEEGRYGSLRSGRNSPASTPEDPDNAIYAWIVNAKDGLCIDTDPTDHLPGTHGVHAVDFKECNGDTDQSWHIFENGEIRLNHRPTLDEEDGKKCLTIATDKKVKFMPCDSGAHKNLMYQKSAWSQKWHYDKTTLRITNSFYNLCLEYKAVPNKNAAAKLRGELSAKQCTTRDYQEQMFNFPSATTGNRGHFTREVQVLRIHCSQTSKGVFDGWDLAQKWNSVGGAYLGGVGFACIWLSGGLCTFAAGLGLFSGAFGAAGLTGGGSLDFDTIAMSHGDQKDRFFGMALSPFKTGQNKTLEPSHQAESRMILDQDEKKICLWEVDFGPDDRIECVPFQKNHPPGVYTARVGKGEDLEAFYEMEYKVIENKQGEVCDCRCRGDCNDKYFCDTSSQCGSGCCINQMDGLFGHEYDRCHESVAKFPCIGEVNKIPIGAHCDSDDDCASGACDIRALIGVLTGTCECNHKFGGRDCPVGEECQHRDMKANVCRPPAALGESCENDSDCETGQCDIRFGIDGTCECDKGNDKGCASGERCQYNELSANECITPKRNGANCDRDSDCASYSCDIHGLHGGKCQCTTDNHCDSGEKCQHREYEGNECSKPKDLGKSCKQPSDCASGSCDIRFGIAITTGTCECNTHRNQGCASGQKCLYNSMSANKCATLKNLGHGCSRDDECKSGECDGVCECNSAKGGRDCPSGQTCQYNRSIPNACVPPKNRADGVDCDNDNQCRSDCCNSFSRVCYTTGWAEPCW